MAFSTRGLAAGAAFLMIFGFGQQVLAPPRPIAERGVRLALIRLNTLLGRRDSAIVDEFAHSDDVLMIGANAGERWQGVSQIAEAFQQMFARPETFSFAWREVDVSVRADVAWLHAEGEVVLTGEGGAEVARLPYRLAAVLEPEGGRWKWRFFQGSQGAAAQPASA